MVSPSDIFGTSRAELLDILYEDEDLLVLNKPAGISVHPSKHEPSGTISDLIVQHDSSIAAVGEDLSRPGIVHRLDKDTTGVLVAVKNQQTFAEIKELFQKRQVQKVYLAIVDGQIKAPRGLIEFPIGRIGLKRVVTSGKKQPLKIREAKTEYIVRKRFNDATLVELRPVTGRMHQLRVHLKAIGHPILGDKLYGGKTAALRASRQMLHALSLSFSRENGKSYKFEAEPPEDFQELLYSLSEELNAKKENNYLI